jgi:hypothetical protein
VDALSAVASNTDTAHTHREQSMAQTLQSLLRDGPSLLPLRRQSEERPKALVCGASMSGSGMRK